MMVSKVMAKLKFGYPLKHDLPICDGSLFSFDLSSFMWLAL
jgi:hypothetical protein